eukprot:CAMPEP_0174891214 /NCGR_PEP_ID=MMETSP0167-20121228/6289_1 /TAXON_ID=38298 /ORGANISM="Rhodella maculata, Strain CCMP736" /LENGTH=73 /DNA_ID=CAMNT_0016129281 /DNA_START=322 /DNA_END=543 /DNA_ORIENTATION=-
MNLDREATEAVDNVLARAVDSVGFVDAFVEGATERVAEGCHVNSNEELADQAVAALVGCVDADVECGVEGRRR